MIVFGRDFWQFSGLSAPAGLPKEGCPGLCWDGFWISPKRRFHRLFGPWKLFIVFSVKKCIPMFKGNLLHFSLCSSCHWAPLETAWLHPLYILPSGIYEFVFVLLNHRVGCLSGYAIFGIIVKAEYCDSACYSGLGILLGHDDRILTALLFSPQSCFRQTIIFYYSLPCKGRLLSDSAETEMNVWLKRSEISGRWETPILSKRNSV